MEQLTLVDTGPTLTTIDILESDLILDTRLQPRVGMDTPTVAAYEALYREGHDLGPLVVFDDGETAYLADGFHRRLATLAAGLASLPAAIHRGTFRDALLYATGCNKHGKQLTNADKRKAVMTLLQDQEWALWSNNMIAKHCGVSHTFVNTLRSSLEMVSSENGHSETNQPTTRYYISRHGQQVTMQVDAIGHRNGQATCANCHRPLTDADSIRRGIGPVCACKTPSAAAGTAGLGPLLQDTSARTPPALEAPPTAEPTLAQRFQRALESIEALVTALETADLVTVQTKHAADCLAITERCQHLMTVRQPAPVEAPVGPAKAQDPYAGLTGRVWAQLQRYGTKGTTGAKLAKAVGAPHDKVGKTLTRLVQQGKATKKGATYVARKDAV